MEERITYQELVEQLALQGIRVTDGIKRLYVALNNNAQAEVFGNSGPAIIRLVEGKVVVEEQTLH